MHGFSLAYIFGAGACLISLLLAFCSPHISKGAGSAFGPWPNNHEIDQIAIKMTGPPQAVPPTTSSSSPRGRVLGRCRWSPFEDSLQPVSAFSSDYGEGCQAAVEAASHALLFQVSQPIDCGFSG